MNAPRFFVAEPIGSIDSAEERALPDAVAHHAGRVLRLAAGERIVLFDGHGGEYAATLTRIDKRAVFARIEQHDAIERESPLDITLAQAVLPTDAMDYAVRKAIELGAARIVPLLTERSQRTTSRDRTDKRRAHWQSIAIAACEQCGRNRVPPVSAPMDLDTFVDDAVRAGPVAVAGLGASRSLADLARESPPRHVVIGPEGGLSERELARVSARGAHRVHLGPRVLRAETAAVAALAMLAAAAGDAR